MSESSDKKLSDFAMSDFEQQLKSLAPRESTVNRDDLLFRAGYEAGFAAKSKEVIAVPEVVSVPLMKTALDPRMQWVAVAVLVFVGAMCVVIGMQVGDRRAVARQMAVKNGLKQLDGIGSNRSKSDAILQLEPLPPVYEADDPLIESFASSNEPNYIELRDQVLRFGVDVMPENYSLALPVKSHKERKAITPLSYGAVIESNAERY